MTSSWTIVEAPERQARSLRSQQFASANIWHSQRRMRVNVVAMVRRVAWVAKNARFHASRSSPHRTYLARRHPSRPDVKPGPLVGQRRPRFPLYHRYRRPSLRPRARNHPSARPIHCQPHWCDPVALAPHRFRQAWRRPHAALHRTQGPVRGLIASQSLPNRTKRTLSISCTVGQGEPSGEDRASTSSCSERTELSVIGLRER
jgi:hypothetical protein